MQYQRDVILKDKRLEYLELDNFVGLTTGLISLARGHSAGIEFHECHDELLIGKTGLLRAPNGKCVALLKD